MALEEGFWAANVLGDAAHMNAALCKKGLTADIPAHDASLTGRWYYDSQAKLLKRDAASAWEDLDLSGHFTAIAHSTLTGVTSDQHHAQAHGASDHTDITRKLFIPAASMKHDGTETTLGYHFVIQMADAVIKYARSGFYVPDDFVDDDNQRLYVIWSSPAASGDMHAVLDIDYGAATEDYNTHTYSAGALAATTNGANKINVSVLPSYLLWATAGDYVGFKFNRYGNHASDTLSNVANILGIAFWYTATQ